VLNLVRDRWRVRQRQAETLSADPADFSPVADAAELAVGRQLLLRACRLLPVHQLGLVARRPRPRGQRGTGPSGGIPS
jgi:hypothetical protein